VRYCRTYYLHSILLVVGGRGWPGAAARLFCLLLFQLDSFDSTFRPQHTQAPRGKATTTKTRSLVTRAAAAVKRPFPALLSLRSSFPSALRRRRRQGTNQLLTGKLSKETNTVLYRTVRQTTHKATIHRSGRPRSKKTVRVRSFGGGARSLSLSLSFELRKRGIQYDNSEDDPQRVTRPIYTVYCVADCTRCARRAPNNK